ncbi:MAG: hypothetical protein PHU23_01625 [Dehalococcoidales bacterium]|nr:hypothetical protein [Dehalococcoidales bacterium]
MRIGINIPDELLKRMEPLKNVTNISQVCRNSIKSYVESFERAASRIEKEGMSKVAERLSNDLVPDVIDWELLGIEDAKMWVQVAKVEDFKILLERLKEMEKQGRLSEEVLIPRVQGVKVFEQRSYEQGEWFDKQIESDPLINPYVEAKLTYQRGKVSYIMAVWKKAENIAQEKYKAKVDELQKNRQKAQEQITVPDGLIDTQN